MTKKIPIVKIYKYYFFNLFKREIKVPYEIRNDGKIVFARLLTKREKAIVTWRYK